MNSQIYQPRFLDSIHDIPAAQWNALAGTDYPFLRHEFLSALEDSGSTSAATGWTPHHFLLQAGDTLQALLPLYIKHNSFGEYVFDWSWADAYHQYGLNYYPKLLSAIPFTPAQGPRFCVLDETRRHTLLQLSSKALQAECEVLGASGWHLLFPSQADSDVLDDLGIRQRKGCQYHWFNRDYADFDALLASFASRKRKNIRKERQRVADSGIQFRVLGGEDISERNWRDFYRFYEHTYLIRGRPPYLNKDFFLLLGERMPEQLVLVLAEAAGHVIAAALSFRGGQSLYGRYWGSDADYQFLHFETCYYQGIDYCIRHGLQHFDSGAQGEHKIQRGFEPVASWSNHWLSHADFQDAIDRFLSEESRHIDHYIRHASEFLPFRRE